MPKAPSLRGLSPKATGGIQVGTPSVIACGDATFPKGTAFGGGGKVSGVAIRRPLGGAGERSEPEGVLPTAGAPERVRPPSKSLAYQRRVRYYILYTL